MWNRIKDWGVNALKALDSVKMSEIGFVILAAFAINLVLSFFGLASVGQSLAIIAIVADALFALYNQSYKRLASKGLAYLLIVLASAGVAKYTGMTDNFVFIGLFVFSAAEIIGSIRKILKI